MRQLPAYSDWGLHAGPITGPGTCFSITGAASGLVSIREAGRTTPQQWGSGSNSEKDCGMSAALPRAARCAPCSLLAGFQHLHHTLPRPSQGAKGA